MVRSKTLASGRKQRIEGIVQSLSAKVHTKEVTVLSNGAEQTYPLASFQDMQQRTEPQWTITSNQSNDSVYHLPQGLEFAGVHTSQPLLKGRRFGPFPGKITPGTEQFKINHTFVSQIPDLDGNPHSLHLFTRTMASCMWLKCLQRCSLPGVYNVVAYNTPKGVVLEVVAEIGRGSEMCVAYDQSYDVAELSLLGNEIIEIPSREPTPEKTVERFTKVRASNEPDLLTPSEESCPLPCSSNVGGLLETKESQDEIPKQSEATYSVMTAEVPEDVHPVKKEDTKNDADVVRRPSKSTRSSVDKANIKDDEKDRKNPFFRAYRCHTCKKQFDSHDEKQRHLETSHSRECPICSKSYSRAYLKEHMMFHLEAARLTCTICSKVFSSISNLRKHQKKHAKRSFHGVIRKGGRTFQCSECPEKFKSQKQLEVHKAKHVRVVPISCDECDKIFTHKSLLRKHQMVVHRGKKPYSCKHCHKTFTQSGNLARHCRQAHSDTKEVREEGTRQKYLCRRRGCDQKSFTSRELFIKHLEQHSGSGGVYPCKECNGVFSSPSNLCKHRKSLHSKKATTTSTAAKFSCDMCKQTFQSGFLYHRHIRAHKTNKSGNKCDKCGKTFANRSGLSKHIRLRRCAAIKDRKPVKPQKIHKCSICSKSFFTVLELRTHRRSHSQEDNHVCDVCGKSFSQRGNLGKHKRHVHQGVPRPRDKIRSKNLTCDVCHKTFKTAGGMEMHKRLHTDRKPLKCDFCDRKFSNMGGRKKHMMACMPIAQSDSTSNKPEPVVPPLIIDNVNTEPAPEPTVSTGIESRWHDYSADGLASAEGDDFLAEPRSPVF